jgi:hypothetical protein
MKCINLGHSGAGNTYIYTSLLDQIVKMNPDDIGLVIPAWTQAQRKDIKIRNRWRHLDSVRNHLYKKDITVYGDMQYRIEESILYYYNLQEICKSKKIPLYQFQMLGIGDGFNWDPKLRTKGSDNFNENVLIKILQFMYQNSYYNEIDDTFLGWPTYNFLGGFNIRVDVLEGHDDDKKLKYQISDIDVHPNAKGQIKITEFLYEQINR